MELDYIPKINEFGESILRLYNFDKAEAIKFRNLIQNIIVDRNQRLDLSQVDFIERRNCNLILGIFKSDEGILSKDMETFYCMLTLDGFVAMLKILEPFCEKETKGYQYLYDIDNPTEFLFSPAGTW